MNWLGLVLIILIVTSISLTLITNKRNTNKLKVEIKKLQEDLARKEDECDELRKEFNFVALNNKTE